MNSRFPPYPEGLVFLALAILSVGTVPPVQGQPTDACRTYLRQEFTQEDATQPCSVLATAIRARISSSLDSAAQASRQSAVQTLQERLTPRDFQIPQGQVGHNAGLPTQGGSAPSIQSVGLAGGNLASVGTERGPRTLATTVLNPASLFGGPHDQIDGSDANDQDSLSVALSNHGDVTLIVPIQDVEEGEALDYLGMRTRINVTSLVQGVESFEQVEEQWLSTLRSAGDVTNQIYAALTRADDLAACAEALLRVPKTGIQAANPACNAEFEPLSLTEDDYATLRSLTRKALAEADEEYFGLDLRLDVGNPTLGAADSARGKRLFTGLAWGRRYGPALSARTEIRLHGGVRYVDLNATDTAIFAAEGGLDLGFSKRVDKQRLQGSVGLSFSAGSVQEAFEEAAETNHLRARMSLDVPVGRNYGLSVNFATPLVGEATTTLSVTTNWHLLLPGSR